MRTFILILLMMLAISINSCKKSSTVDRTIQSFNFRNGECLVLDDSSQNAYSTYQKGELVAFTNEGKFLPVTLWNDQSNQIEGYYSIEYIYDINRNNLMIILADPSKIMHSYIVNKINGSIVKSIETLGPMVFENGIWTYNINSNAIIHGLDSCYYFRTQGNICKMSFSDNNTLTLNEIPVAGNTLNFTVSADGYVMIDNTIYSNNSSYVVTNFNNSSCYICPGISTGFYMLSSLTNSSELVQKIQIKNQNVI